MNPNDLKDCDEAKMVKAIQKLNDDKFSAEFRMKKKDGKYLWVALKGKVVERQGGQVKRFVGTIADISEEKQRTREKLETILATEDNERNRIAKEIHDGLQQILTISSINIEFVKRESDQLTQRTQEKLNTGWEYLQRSIAESRSVAHALMPRDILGFGLVVAIKNLIQDYDSAIENISFSFDDNLNGKRIQDNKVEVCLYRILQESLNNIIKYSKAARVSVQLKNYDDIILLTIEDDGIGFNLDKTLKEGTGFGLRSMQNRIVALEGHLEIDTAPGKGTVVVVEIPQNQSEPLVV